MREWTYKKVKREIKRLDSTMRDGDAGYASAAILLSALVVGPNIERLIKFTGLKRAEVKRVCNAARENNIFVGGRVKADWFKKGTGSFAFWADTLVCDGLLSRVKA